MLEGKYVIVRDDKAGVYAGTLAAEGEGKTVWLRDCRQLWQWEGAETVLCLALRGTIRPNACKFTAVHPGPFKLTADSGMVLCTPEARASIEAVPVWEAT